MPISSPTSHQPGDLLPESFQRYGMRTFIEALMLAYDVPKEAFPPREHDGRCLKSGKHIRKPWLIILVEQCRKAFFFFDWCFFPIPPMKIVNLTLKRTGVVRQYSRGASGWCFWRTTGMIHVKACASSWSDVCMSLWSNKCSSLVEQTLPVSPGPWRPGWAFNFHALLQEWALGMSRLFLKAGQLKALEDMRTEGARICWDAWDLSSSQVTALSF